MQSLTSGNKPRRCAWTVVDALSHLMCYCESIKGKVNLQPGNNAMSGKASYWKWIKHFRELLSIKATSRWVCRDISLTVGDLRPWSCKLFPSLKDILRNSHFTFPMLFMTDEARHEKTDLKGFVAVIPKEGWPRVARAHPSFGMTPTFREYNLRCQQSQILKSRCHTKRRMGAATHAHPSFGMTTTKTLRSVFSWCASNSFSLIRPEIYCSLHIILLAANIWPLAFPASAYMSWERFFPCEEEYKCPAAKGCGIVCTEKCLGT